MAAIITLTTDFGTVDGYVGAMKGRILSMTPEATLVDITHDIEPQRILQAAWCLKRSAIEFPVNSIHIAVIDPGVGSSRPAVLLKSQNRWFIGPDNGVFSEILKVGGIQEGYRLHDQTEWWKKHSSFDGLALFAPAAACLAKGIDPAEMGEPWTDFTILESPAPTLEIGRMVGEIILFDRFGNAITNIDSSVMGQLSGKPVSATTENGRFSMVEHYDQGTTRKGVAIINSDGLLELSVFSDSARIRYHLKVGDRVVLSIH